MDLPLILALLSTLGAGLGWIYEWRQRRDEAQKREEAEAELKLIQRRGNAPYLIPFHGFIELLYHTNPSGETGYWSPSKHQVLCHSRSEVDRSTPAGTAVILVFENHGLPARRMTARLDGDLISLCQEPPLLDSRNLQYFIYAYCPEMHGKEQRLILEFETPTGNQDRHIYRTTHGVRELFRVDPA